MNADHPLAGVVGAMAALAAIGVTLGSDDDGRLVLGGATNRIDPALARRIEACRELLLRHVLFGWDWPGIVAAEAAARERLARCPRCTACDALMVLGQKVTHHVCAVDDRHQKHRSRP